jgi:hypothetical protein
MMFVFHRKHTYEPPRPVTEIALLLYMNMTFVRHRKQTYGPPRAVTGLALLYLNVNFPECVNGGISHTLDTGE